MSRCCLSYHLWCSIGYVGFFSKQKTAYEMRISDWSSDVCSSDLAEPRRSEPWLIASVRLSITRTKGMMPLVLPLRPTGSPMPRTLPQYVPMPPPREASQTFPFHVLTMPSDLQSVVPGKGGPVRVNHGGRRLITKKK